MKAIIIASEDWRPRKVGKTQFSFTFFSSLRPTLNNSSANSSTNTPITMKESSCIIREDELLFVWVFNLIFSYSLAQRSLPCWYRLSQVLYDIFLFIGFSAQRWFVRVTASRCFLFVIYRAERIWVFPDFKITITAAGVSEWKKVSLKQKPQQSKSESANNVEIHHVLDQLNAAIAWSLLSRSNNGELCRGVLQIN